MMIKLVETDSYQTSTISDYFSKFHVIFILSSEPKFDLSCSSISFSTEYL